LEVRTDDMELAGHLVQGICDALGIVDRESTADFPVAMLKFQEVIASVNACKSQRLALSASVADSTNQIKMMITRAEEARVLGEMPQMNQTYMELYKLNQETINAYNIRAANHKDLLQGLKAVNSMIQCAARLRRGTHKSKVVAACRQAIKQNNLHALENIMRQGHAD